MTAFPNDRERDVRAYLKGRLAVMGGELRKVTWFMKRGAPDEFVMVPARAGIKAFSFFAELKRPGQKPEMHQMREIEKLRRHGQTVHVIDSREAVDAILFWGPNL